MIQEIERQANRQKNRQESRRTGRQVERKTHSLCEALLAGKDCAVPGEHWLAQQAGNHEMPPPEGWKQTKYFKGHGKHKQKPAHTHTHTHSHTHTSKIFVTDMIRFSFIKRIHMHPFLRFVPSSVSNLNHWATLHVMQLSHCNKSKCSDDSHSSVKLEKNVLPMSLKYTPVTQSIVCLIFLTCAATMHHINSWTRIFEKNKTTVCSLWFWHTHDLEIGQGHHTRYELLDTTQSYNGGKFESPPLNSVCQEANVNVVDKLKKTHQLSPLKMCKSEK